MKRILLFFSFLLVYVGVDSQTVNQQLKTASKMQESMPDSCILISQKVLTKISDTDIKDKGYAYWNLAQSYLYKHQYHTALFYALKGNELFAKSDTSRLYQDIQATIGWIYFDIGNYQYAVPYHQKALEIAQLRANLSEEVLYTNALGLNALSSNHYQRALGFFQKALFILNSSEEQNRSLLSTVQNNMGIIYIHYEDWVKAETFLHQSLENSSGVASGLLETYSLLSRVYLNTLDYEKCKAYLDKAENVSYKTSYSFSLIEYYKVRYEYERVIGNLKSAYRYQNKYIQLYKKINNRNVQGVMNYLIEVQDEKIKQDKLLIEQAQKIALNRQILVFVGIALAIIVIGILYYVFKSKAERSLLRQKLLKQELDEKEELQAELSSKLAYKNEAIETLALTMSKRNELVKKVAEDVSKSSSADVKKAWRKFEQAFNQYSDSSILSDKFIKDFKYRVQSQFPDLTNKELQLLVDIRNDLTSKELAEKYHVEVKSIEMSRYRLRKKLHLEKGVQLKDFIMKL
ncbi:hypothetical protein [Carboxylicivirga marina]|uniref:hypothetical protein n=1 Tax=Carboxylicivirga marina TaxID=2800988 RepID=UPI00259454FF|nr:hypothetical protein [uncultured Carboxylicivirga sp.]